MDALHAFGRGVHDTGNYVTRWTRFEVSSKLLGFRVQTLLYLSFCTIIPYQEFTIVNFCTNRNAHNVFESSSFRVVF
jgi:hypothetical protein